MNSPDNLQLASNEKPPVNWVRLASVSIIGGLASLGFQAYHNDQAWDKIGTVNNCAETLPQGDTLDQEFIICLESGEAGVKVMNFDRGDPAGNVDAYIRDQTEKTDYKPWAAVAISGISGFFYYLGFALYNSKQEESLPLV